PASNCGPEWMRLRTPRVRVVPFSQARHPQGLYPAVETGRTFFSLPSGIFTFLLPSLAKPGTWAAAGDAKLNVYDAIRSSVVHSRTLRGFKPLPIRLILSS